MNPNVIFDTISKAVKTSSDGVRAVLKIIATESDETRRSVLIVLKFFHRGRISHGEKLFLAAHSKDLLRILPHVLLKFIPIPIPMTPLLILLGKRMGIDLIPKDNRHLLDEEEQENENWNL